MTIKAVVIGDGGTGKTSMLDYMIHGRIIYDTPSTFGVGFYIDAEFDVRFWDIGTMQSKEFEEIYSFYYTDATIAFITFDRHSAIEDWIDRVRRYCPDIERIVLVHTRCDLGIRSVHHSVFRNELIHKRIFYHKHKKNVSTTFTTRNVILSSNYTQPP